MAQCAADPVPLPLGKPAGVKQAEIYISPTIFVIGVIGFIALGYELAKVPLQRFDDWNQQLGVLGRTALQVPAKRTRGLPIRSIVGSEV